MTTTRCLVYTMRNKYVIKSENTDKTKTIEVTGLILPFENKPQRNLCSAQNETPEASADTKQISEPGFDPGTCGLWAHHASAAPL
ncbi:hypothetical protein SUGI_0559670 [Cryptomeria japonica]|nr:hypothetical protein SUGI_0559670 [Cryptomeria japonica]